ncbi:hypothetical protein RCL1_000994 [Eukaryota sp. TZLM3-RCL]
MSTVAPRDYHCNNCRANISSEVHIRCAECADFDLCLNCFSVGVELDDHKKTHCYRVLDFSSSALFESHWTAEDELLLMEAIELYGLCNWEGIAEHIGRVLPSEVKRHYLKTYTHGPNKLPDPSITSPIPTTAPPPYALEPEPLPPKDDKAPSELPEPKTKEEEAQRKHQTTHFYNPLRHDFVEEYKNDADKALVSLTQIKDNSPLMQELQAELFMAYNDLVSERNFRKNFIVERDLLNPANRDFKQQKNMSEAEKELRNDVKIFAQFYSPHEFEEEFLKPFLEDFRIRKQLEDISKGIQLGINSMEELRRYFEDEEPSRQKMMEDHKLRVDKLKGLCQRSVKSYKGTPK